MNSAAASFTYDVKHLFGKLRAHLVVTFACVFLYLLLGFTAVAWHYEGHSEQTSWVPFISTVADDYSNYGETVVVITYNCTIDNQCTRTEETTQTPPLFEHTYYIFSWLMIIASTIFFLMVVLITRHVCYLWGESVAAKENSDSRWPVLLLCAVVFFSLVSCSFLGLLANYCLVCHLHLHKAFTGVFFATALAGGGGLLIVLWKALGRKYCTTQIIMFAISLAFSVAFLSFINVDPNDVTIQTKRAACEWIAVYTLLIYYHTYAYQLQFYKPRGQWMSIGFIAHGYKDIVNDNVQLTENPSPLGGISVSNDQP